MSVRLPLVAAVSAAVLLTAACGSGSDSDPGSSSGGSSPESEIGSVGVILPDTASSTRWETKDAPLLKKAFKDAGVKADIQNAQGDASRMQTIADQMITQGVAVLAIVNLDSASGAAIEKKAKAQGVQTIDYDRLTLGGSSDYYVSFDNTKVGELQGEGLAKCLGADPANIAFLNGSPTDNNATLFSEGAHSVLDPMSQYTQVAEQAVPDWDNQEAATIFEQMLTQNPDIKGVYAANDGLGNAAISILAKNNLAGQVAVTGQDATTQGLQNILAGNQCMTVYKAVEKEADALAETAIALAKGEEPETTGTVKDAEGDREVSSILLDPESITKENVQTVIDDGFATVDEVCTPKVAEFCTEAGIS